MTSVRLVGSDVIVSRASGEVVLSSLDDLLDFRGTGDEREAVQAVWSTRQHVPRGGPRRRTPAGETPADLALMARVEGGLRLRRTERGRVRKLRAVGLLDADGYVTEAGREVMERCGVRPFRQEA